MNSLAKAASGHEIWVLPETGYGHRGHEFRCRVFYGHALHPDGRAITERLTAWAVNPGGEKMALAVEEREDCHIVRLVPEREGLWALVVEHDIGPLVLTKGGLYKPGSRKEYPDARSAAYYYQYAKTCFPVGHFCPSCGDLFRQADVSSLGTELEIVGELGEHRLGSEITLQVRYRGVPLPNAPVLANWSLSGKKDWSVRLVTDTQGRVTVRLSEPGHWVFYARHRDKERGIPGEYEERVVSVTLSFYGIR